MFEEFSRGYYLGRLYVEPGESETTLMCRDQHDHISQQLYEEDGATGPSERPLVVKLGSCHLAVHPEEGVPADTLSVPGDVLAETRVYNPPALREVLLAKAERAAQLLRLTGATPATDERVGEGGPAGI